MGEYIPEQDSASSFNHFGPHSEWKMYLATKISTKDCQLATNRWKKKGKHEKFIDP